MICHYLPLPVNKIFLEKEVNTSNILIENRAKLGIWKDSKIICCFTSSETSLGIDLLLKNLKEIFDGINEKISIIIAPDSKRNPNIINDLNKKIESASKLGNIQIILLDFSSEEEKIKIIDDCNLYIAPCNKEKYDINIIEAWSREKPVIAFNTLSNLELFGLKKSTNVVDSNDFGILIDINDNSTSLLNVSINSLLNDVNKSKMMGHNGKNRVIKKYSWDNFLSKYYEIYKS